MPIERLFDHPGVMITPDDLTSPERTEQARRSVVMLTPGQMALSREEAMMVLDRLLAYMNAGPDDRR